MEANLIKCPNCGANVTNHKNCEYCGSLLVRFAEKGIDISNTPYIDNSFVFPGLIEALEKNLEYQKEKKCGICTSILYQDKLGWNIGYFSGMHIESYEEDLEEENDPNLYISRCFNICNNSRYADSNKINELMITRLSLLKSFPLFEKYESEDGELEGGGNLIRYEYGIDMGQDAEGAARLISEIIMKVDEICITDPVFIYTYYDNDEGNAAYTRAYNNWCRAHGLEGEIYDEQEQNKEELSLQANQDENVLSDYSEEQEDKGWGEWHKVLVCICSIPLGICIIKHWPTRFWCNWFYLIGCILLLIVLGLFWIRRLPKKYFYYFLIPYFILPICFLDDFKMPKFRWLDQKDSSDKVELRENANEERKIEETEQTPKKSRKDEIRELGFNDGVNFGYSDGGDALREYVRSGQTLQNGLDHMQKVIAKVAYKEEYGDNISEELLDEYAKQFVEGYKSIVLKK